MNIRWNKGTPLANEFKLMRVTIYLVADHVRSVYLWDPENNLLEIKSQMAKRRHAVDKLKILTDDLKSMTRLTWSTIVVVALCIGLSCVSIWLQYYNANLMRQAEIQHRKFINRLTYASITGDTSRTGQRNFVATGDREQGKPERSQCRYRQKTEWIYYDAQAPSGENSIVVDFTASEVTRIPFFPIYSQNSWH